MAKIDFSSTATAVIPDGIKDFGVGYFNPLIGDTPAETCGNISDVMQTLYEVFKGDELDLHGARNGLLLIMQTVWSAAQYTSNSNQEGAA